MFGLLPIEGSWFLRFEKLLKEFFLKSPRPSLPLKRAPPLTPTLSPSGEREGGNRPTRCSEPLRSKVGGPSKVSPDCAGWDRLGATCLRVADGVGDRLASIQVLVNVDIFSEGFDCPDIEFVQLARPTLSLAKYLQMVGRGLRVAKGKKNCVIIDNVGLYRVFGLPSQVWNWNAMFE